MMSWTCLKSQKALNQEKDHKEDDDDDDERKRSLYSEW